MSFERAIINGKEKNNSIYPLSKIECGMYVEQKLHPESVSYIMSVIFYIKGTDAESIHTAVRDTLRVHDALHSCYGEYDGVMHRIIKEEVPKIIDGEPLSQSEFEKLLQNTGEPFDLEKEIPVRLSLYPLHEGGFGLHMQIHHIAFDGVSAEIFASELVERINKKESTCDICNVENKVALQKNAEDKNSQTDSLAFFEKMFEGGVPENELPLKGIRPQQHPMTDTRIKNELDVNQMTLLKSKAKTFNVTVFELLIAIYAAIVGEYCGSEDVVVSIPVNVRDSTNVNTIGMFVNSVPVRLRPIRNASLSDYLSQVSKMLRQATHQKDVSFDELVNRFCENRSESHNPLFDIGINYLHVPKTKYAGQVSVDHRTGLQELPQDIGLQIYRSEDSMQVIFQYPSKLFDADVMENFAEQFIENLRRVSNGEVSCVQDLMILPVRQLAQLESFSQSEQKELKEILVHKRFEETVLHNADRLAVIACDKTLTFDELNCQANRIADKFIELGVKCGDSIILLLPRRSFYFSAAIGVLKAGASFIPCDPEYPIERVMSIAEDAKASFIVTTKERMPEYAGNNAIDIDMLLEGGRSENPCVQVTGEDLAYMIYTSGSTGKPKGVLIKHIGVCNYFEDEESNVFYHQIKRSKAERILCLTTVSFDLSIHETFGILVNGKTVVFADEDKMNNPVALTELIDKYDIDILSGTPSRIQQYMEYEPFAGQIKRMKVIGCGGEAYSPALKEQLADGTDAVLVNCYGPTEITIACNMAILSKDKPITIGRPTLNVHEYILDVTGNPVPRGVVGELYIGGIGVARGYNNLEQQTQERFVDYKGERFYRSGDYAKWDISGNVNVLGRMDNQVKLNGLRIELGEIEGLLEKQQGIRKAIVAIRKVNAQEQLCAWYMSERDIDIDELKKELKKKLTAYMIPAVYTRVENFPVLLSGKINMKALPEPKFVQEEECIVNMPLNALETEIRSIAGEVLGTEDFGVMQKLSRIGLTSISAIRLATMIYKKYGVSLNVTELISAGTIQMIENAILLEWMNGKSDFKSTNSDKGKAIESTDSSKKIRLSFSQQGVYAECMATTDSTLYNTPLCVKFPPEVSADELKVAVCKVVAAHPSFSIRFTYNSNNDTVQYLVPDYEPEISITKMSEEEFEKYCAEFVRPFVLNDEPLSRFEIIVSDELYLLMDIHHLITDGASVDIFLRQLCECMDGEIIKREEYTYFDYVADEEITLETEQFIDSIMSDFEEATRLIPDVYDEGRQHVSQRVSVQTNLKEVAEFASRNGVTPAAVYLAAEYIVASRYVCEDSVAITTISNGRSNMSIYNTTGMFVNTLPLSVKIDNEEETISFLRRVANNYSNTIAHEHYPFAKVVQKFDFHPSLSYTYQVGVFDEYRVHGKLVSAEGLELKEAKLPCSVYIEGSTEAGGEIQIDYDEALYSEGMMINFAKSIDNVVREIMSKKTLKEISLTDEEQWRILDTYNREFNLDYDHSDTVVSLFRKQVADKPDKVAAVYKDKEYTFRALDELTDRLAEIIYSNMYDITGLDNLAEQVIPIILSRNEFAFILPLAVLKTGCAYEPLDPDYPSDRLNFMVKDSGAKLLIAQRGLEESVNEFEGTIVYIDELCEKLNNGYNPAINIADIPAPKPENLLIMLYTSGTTGVPKGVQLIHENLVAFAHGSALDGLYTAKSKTATYASFGFDVNMADTFCTILNGGTIYLIAEDARMNLDALAEYFDEAGITDVLLTTQVGVQFINSFPKLKSLRMLTVGGEKLPAISTDALSYAVYNGYGPTENCAGVSIFKVKEWEPNIPIGKPFPSINAFVLDKTGHRLPAGAAGEYCLSGPQVGRGYLNRPDKTAESFEDCPFNKFRMYHTGDIVRYRQNGDVEFVGRKDGQVKIRGFRVELKEIEAVIREFEGVDDVTVQAYDFSSGGKYLAAFVVASEKLDEKGLCEFIKEQKPAYMVPAAIMQIGEIPLTVNQKVDKKALPKPELKKGEYTAPQTEAEKNFCRIFGEILGIEKVGAEDDFFELGGSSITAMKVVLAAGKVGYSIVYQDVFDNSTSRLLATLVEDTNCESSSLMVTDASDASNITYIGRDGYDYTAINEMLKNNNLDTFKNGKCQELGDVLLTGSTGFLGIHVLYELINMSDNRIYCLSRSKNGVSGKDRLMELLKTYFDKDFEELFDNRIFVIEGDGVETDTLKDFAPDATITVINCAANVAHFSKGDAIWNTNVNLVKNLISWCVEHNSNLVHVSTGSVSGATENGVPGDNFKLSERILYGGQLVENNQYIHSKFTAERLVYEAILEKGLRAKVMRVSNLAPRFEDGMMQVNYKTNNFLNSLKAYYLLGKISYTMMSTSTELSPIDYVAKAVLTLAKTPQECTCFNLANEYMPKMGDVLLHLSSLGRQMRLVEPEELSSAIDKALEDSQKAELMNPLLAYASSKREGNVRIYGFDVLDSDYTMQVLYRLGFRWPLTDGLYVERFVTRLKELGYFE